MKGYLRFRPLTIATGQPISPRAKFVGQPVSKFAVPLVYLASRQVSAEGMEALNKVTNHKTHNDTGCKGGES